MPLLTAFLQQEGGLRRGLHSLGDHLEIKIVRHGDERADDRGILRVFADLADEAAVDLDARQREVRQRAQRRIAGAEIVEGELDALSCSFCSDRSKSSWRSAMFSVISTSSASRRQAEVAQRRADVRQQRSL